MRSLIVTLVTASFAIAADSKPATLTPKEIAEGWILLFDGETAFGWSGRTENAVNKGVLGPPIGEVKAGPFPAGTMIRSLGEAREEKVLDSVFDYVVMGKAPYDSIKYQPAKMESIFNGKDLTGWKLFEGDPKRKASKFKVTKDGELHVLNGPGDLQTEKTYDDFLLQFECKTNGKGLNSGIFFRCRPGEYQQGYEAQIQNLFNSGDRSKPTDFGTGAIYRRFAARKVVSNDEEWFTMTVLAVGPHLRTWVNGYPVVSWIDDRKEADNARNGRYLNAGHLSIQGHDPTTDILFRNFRIVEIKK